MPPQRTPLGVTSGNATRGTELSPYERGRAVGMHSKGASLREISKSLKRNRTSITGAMALDILNTNGSSLPRPGRPHLYNPRDQRMMLRNLRSYPKLTFQQRREDTGLPMSNSYIKCLARANGMSHWRAKKRPELNKDIAAKRLL